ncbi:MAG: 30S ribosomal protein S6 [Bacillota bacterium]|jgi:small subunit ribosomal protein S6|nr:30S ribosomal protein S6 [Candidatus Fermentithermobacillaceae bacterium]HOA71336.1 30S ribosomal protein S6 [Bacillota bacterium]HPZ85885.1 30S ribosomal protein S6 [Bacillota bacterium]HQD86397.1 30S ribosomal protein S6 [Bacillota bacterium]
MRTYELLVLVRPDFDDEKIASIIARYSEIITNMEGTIITAEKWAKRRLAYEINRIREGIYLIFVFKGTPELSDELDRLLKIDQEIMRHMIVRIDHKLKLEQKLQRERAQRTREGQDEQDEQAEEAAPEAAVVSDDNGESADSN